MIPLRTSHVAFYTALVTLTVTLATGIGFWFIRQEMLAGNDFLLDAESREILARVTSLNSPIDAAKLEAALREHTEYDEALFYFEVFSEQGTPVYRSPNLGLNQLGALTGSLSKRTLDLPAFGLIRLAEYHTPLLQIQIAMSLRNFETVNHSFRLVFLLGIPLIALLSVVFGQALRRSTLRPIHRMQETAQRISATNLSQRIPVPDGGGEMAALAHLLNEMMARLERSFHEVRRFTADTSHELMTPLSIIRLHAEKLASDPELPAKFRHSVEEQLEETAFLTDTLDRLLTLAKAESNVLSLKLLPVATSEYMSQFAEDAQLLSESRGLQFQLTQNVAAEVIFDQGWIRQVLFNLLSNAMRHSPVGGHIQCTSISEGGCWRVEITDEGPGVPEGRLKHIFDRFVQIMPRSEPASGAGLGLAICKSIVELHRGTIYARLRTGRSGLVVTFALPSGKK